MNSADHLRARLLEIARAREGNAEAMRRVSQQLLQLRVVIRDRLEIPWPEARSSPAVWQECVKHLGELILQDLSAQEELGSQIEAGLAITVALRSVLMDMRNQGLDMSEVLARLDQILPHEA